MNEDGGCHRASMARQMRLERMQKLKAKRDRLTTGSGVLGVRRGCGFLSWLLSCVLCLYSLCLFSNLNDALLIF
jgi:hypothetical protein